MVGCVEMTIISGGLMPSQDCAQPKPHNRGGWLQGWRLAASLQSSPARKNPGSTSTTSAASQANRSLGEPP